MQSRANTYSVSTAILINDSSEMLHVGLSKFAWSNAVLGGGLFFLLGLFMIFSGGDTLLFGVLGLSLGAFFAYTYPLKADLFFDYRACQLRYFARYLLRFPMTREETWNITQVVKAERQKAVFGRQFVNVLLDDGSRFVLEFGKKEQAERFLARIDGQARAALAESETAQVIAKAQASETRALMQRELRSWSLWLFIMGAFQMIAAKGFSSWGALLILVGLSALYFNEAPMFIVFATTVAWAGINNLMAGEARWIGYAIFQAILVVQIARQFRRFNALAKEPDAAPARSSRLFPWLALLLGAGGLLGLAGLIVLVILLAAANPNSQMPGIFAYVESAVVYANVLGIGLGLSSLFSGFRWKAASIAGLICGSLGILIELGLVFLL